VTVSPASYGTIMIDQTTVSAYPATHTFSGGAQVNLEAVPAPGYRFDSWSGTLSGSENPVTILIDCNKTITANFSLVVRTLTLQISGNGSITPGTGSYDYAEGTVVSLTATARSGWQFNGWTGDVADADSAETTVTIDSAKTVTARFTERPNQINWPLVGGVIGGLALLAIIVLVVRYRKPQNA
jgi:uncharacterized repeat protein (TIGR02543 family)